jgi:hypothetical protein
MLDVFVGVELGVVEGIELGCKGDNLKNIESAATPS